jgi:hypothetical protein
MSETERSADVVIVGGGLGGVAAALGACRSGATVLLTEESEWLGGQVTSQGIGHLDDHPWIEQFGCTATYRLFRDGIRRFYRDHYPMTATARAARHLNPGAATVSALTFEPRVALAVIEALLAPHRSSGQLHVLTRHRPVSAEVDADEIRAVTVLDEREGVERTLTGRIFLDATETGELLPITGTEYVTGSEARAETQEPHAGDVAKPMDMQAVTWCFVVDHLGGEDHTIDRPSMYEHWKAYRDPEWPNGPLSWTVSNWIDRSPLTYRFEPNPDTPPEQTSVKVSSATDTVDADLWLFRRLISRLNFQPGAYRSDICLVNWGMNDYFDGPIIEVPADVAHGNREAARQLSLSLLYWLQTEAPRSDGGTGFPGLRLRPDVVGTQDGLAMRPYIREGRRIRARTTILEQDLNADVRGAHGAVRYPDRVGIGSYRLDLHPSSAGGPSMEIPALPFHIPLGALLPQRMRNLIAAAKDIGTTHVTNGCYRLHHVEWNIGEVAGRLAGLCATDGVPPEAVWTAPQRLRRFQETLVDDGVELDWPVVAAY